MKTLVTLFLVFISGLATAQSAATWRVRGTIEAFDAPRLVVKESSGQIIILSLADNLTFQEVLPIDPEAIQAGAFVGTAALPRSDGALESIEVVVFPEAARGTGEGHFPWDLKPESSMTNATVSTLARIPGGRKLTLRYKDGEKTVVVPAGIPVVTFKAGDRELIAPGAKVFIVATVRNGLPLATRLVIGRDGFAPPM
jgi:hypothetical protein